jgi:methyltransferase (TIGR00027 family)
MKEGKPSETAIRVAINKVVASGDPELRRLLSDPDEALSEAFVREHSEEAVKQLKMWRNEQLRALAQVFSESMEPGGPLFVLLRKRYIEDQLAAFLEKGARQFVSLGAGYDPLSHRLMPRFPGLRCFEIDHPPTQEVKRRALEKAQALPEGLVLLPVDLSQQTGEDALRAAGFDPQAPSAFLAEAVFMYLSEEEVDAVFATVRRLAAPGSRFVFTVVDGPLLATPGSPPNKTAHYLRLSGEPIRSGVDTANIDPWLRQRGFRFVASAASASLKDSYLTPLGIEREVREGEVIVVSEATGEA